MASVRYNMACWLRNMKSLCSGLSGNLQTMNVSAKIYANSCSRSRGISLDTWQLWPAGGTKGKVRGVTKDVRCHPLENIWASRHGCLHISLKLKHLFKVSFRASKTLITCFISMKEVLFLPVFIIVLLVCLATCTDFHQIWIRDGS